MRRPQCFSAQKSRRERFDDPPSLCSLCVWRRSALIDDCYGGRGAERRIPLQIYTASSRGSLHIQLSLWRPSIPGLPGSIPRISQCRPCCSCALQRSRCGSFVCRIDCFLGDVGGRKRRCRRSRNGKTAEIDEGDPRSGEISKYSSGRAKKHRVVCVSLRSRYLNPIKQPSRVALDHVHSVRERLVKNASVLAQLLSEGCSWQPCLPIYVRRKCFRDERTIRQISIEGDGASIG